MLPDVAVMIDVPNPMPVAPPAATLATEVVPEVQVAEEVMSCVVPSEYLPVAVN